MTLELNKDDCRQDEISTSSEDSHYGFLGYDTIWCGKLAPQISEQHIASILGGGNVFF
jgi:hypothetical protein